MFFVKKNTILLLLIFFSSVQAQTVISLDFNEAINQVLEKNPNLNSVEADLEASRLDVSLAKSNYYPGMKILGSVSQSKTATYSQTAGVIPSSSALAGASLSQLIYNEKKVANIKIQKYIFASQEESYRNTKNNVITKAGLAYIALLFAVDLLEVQQENILITEKNLLSARERYDVGATNMQEVLRWETQFFSDKQAIESQKAAVIIQKGSLNQLLNNPIETNINLEVLTLANNSFIFSNLTVASALSDENKSQIIRSYLVDLGLANSPILASLNQQMLAQNRQLAANKRWAIPSISASASADAKFDLAEENDETTSSDMGFWKVGLTMSMPIIDGGANLHKVQQSKWQISALEYHINDIKTSQEQAIRASAAVIISDYQNIGLAEKQAKAAHRNYQLVYDSYYEGESSLLNLLDAQNQKMVADISTRVALYTFFSDLLLVEQSIGYFHFLEPEEDVKNITQKLELELIESF